MMFKDMITQAQSWLENNPDEFNALAKTYEDKFGEPVAECSKAFVEDVYDLYHKCSWKKISVPDGIKEIFDAFDKEYMPGKEQLATYLLGLWVGGDISREDANSILADYEKWNADDSGGEYYVYDGNKYGRTKTATNDLAEVS